ncbi:MAG: glutamate synthase large subunit [Acidimicrobiaceae bacterium]|nr:glutamate synthase large subunit [Acidimicrobiaceae bacterium]
MHMLRGQPPRQGLYDPQNEHDACGVSFVCDIAGRRSHDVLLTGFAALCNMEHRGAQGADVNTGDGAGILIQTPDRFYRDVVPFTLPPAGFYATGIAFIPQADKRTGTAQSEVERILAEEGLDTLGWRDVPVEESVIGSAALMTMPTFKQIFVCAEGLSDLDLDRRAFIARKRIEHEIRIPPDTAPATPGADAHAPTAPATPGDNTAPAPPDAAPATPGDNTAPGESKAMGGASKPHERVYFPSLSSRTVVYKGMLTPPQLAEFYQDLADDRVESALALVHSRFSTNTFPSWPLAHPYRMIAHNGEINTIQGNRNWMRAREALLESPHLPGLERAFPICTAGASDTAGFDEALELLVLGGYSVDEAVLMMIPEPWEHHQHMDSAQRAFYQFNSTRMEPWDGPASIAFTDGAVIGAVLDRNGLRPSRYWVTDDGLVIMASEVGVVEVPADQVVEKGRLQPGRMFLIDTDEGRIIRDDEIKARLGAARPYRDWIDQNLTTLSDLPPAEPRQSDEGTLTQRQQTFGYTHEEKKLLLAPMAKDAKEAIGSMGTDTPIAVLSNRPRQLSDYFQQLFAQVTNPPLDAIREQIITSLFARVGPEGNLFDPQPSSCRTIHLDNPVIADDELARLAALDGIEGSAEFRTAVLPALYPVAEGAAGMEDALRSLRSAASAAIEEGATVLVLSDRGADESTAAIPSLLATGAVHHHLVREKSRARAGLVVEAGDVRECHHICLLLGYGANAINPYLALETISDMVKRGEHGLDRSMPLSKAHRNFIDAAGKGVLKVMSKMGISTVASYTGAQIFEAIGLSREVADEYFTGTVSRLDGVGLDVLADEVAARHRLAYPKAPAQRSHRSLEVGGEYQWRREGEYHLFNPETVFKLQHATREKRFDVFKEYTALVDDQSKRLGTLRGLFRFNSDRPPAPIDEVESIASIVKRFSTGAMSYGSISPEAHETLAIAMNRIGAKSNTGEGGEDADRFAPDDNGDLRRSAIKQVASGRFGVTSEYLVNADDLQIKMAQGAKPGEGGQLPGNKVYPWIAKTRHSTPGVGLISPPPHHDIYSIEDLAQLIHDLKNANPEARVHVKLVAEVGVGTVAAGVSKAHADVVLISGHDGGTGASPQTSIKHAGVPWELGLAETQQTLLLNDLRDRIVVQCDGQLKTGRDVMIAALLGAEEFGFATAPLVVMGCIMMRVCHLDTCPVGVATQNEKLRENFSGQPEFVVNFVEFIAQEVRELMAELGFRTLDEAIGQVEVLDVSDAVNHWKADGLDLSPILHLPEIARESRRHQWKEQDHGIERALDQTLISLAEGALGDRRPVTIDVPIRNVNRTVGTLLGYEVTKRFGGEGLPSDTIVVNFTGSAGNSFGAFVPRGITLRLEGDANDYVGKGLSGGRLVVRPPESAPFVAEENVIAGNVILYGATGGEAFLRGRVGERFCVRNSGAIAVVEGIGDHGCEYMTGGRAVVLGSTGRNFAAGMSGGIAFVHDPDNRLPPRTNLEMVVLEELNDEDLEWLRDRIVKHRHETGSEIAARILAAWGASSGDFVKVTPTDYRRVMAAAAQAREQGANEVEAIMAASRG